MPGGRRNPLSVTNIVEQLRARKEALNKKDATSSYDGPYVDLQIQVSKKRKKKRSPCQFYIQTGVDDSDCRRLL